MGAETLAAAAITGTATAFGIREQRKARKTAERAANEQRSFQAQQQETVRKESERLNSEIAKTQRKVNAGAARSNRARIRGGIFGESEPTNRTMTPTLG